MKNRFNELMEQHGPKHWSFAAKKDKEFMAWLMAETSDMDESVNFPTRVYCALNNERPSCHRGGERKLISITKGWGFCGRANVCPCAKESVSRSVKASMKMVDQKAIKERARATLIDRYGVTNAGQTKAAREAHSAFYADSEKVKEATEKYKNTMLERYGVKNALQLPIDRLAIAQRNMSQETKEIFLDKDRFEKLVKNNSTPAVASMLGVNPTTVNNYIRAYDIQVHGSSYEREIEALLRDNDIRFVARTRKEISPLELDFYLPDYKVAIEFNGLYFHSDEVVDNHYHRVKWEKCRAAGIRLLMINEDEWNQRPNVIKAKILNLCGLSEKGVGARKLNTRQIENSIAMDFFNKHHIQGSPSTISYSFGAYHDTKLVAVIAYGIQRTTGDVELTRYCSNGNIYAGAFTKLLKNSMNSLCLGRVITFADLRYSDGGVYENNGFQRLSEIRPDYRYVKNGRTFHKSQFTKKRIMKKYGISGITEREAMKQLGYSRIYDCGKIKYEFINDNITSL